MDFKELALAHFEKALLAIAGAWLLVVASSFASQPDALKKNAELTQKMQRIGSYMGSAAPEEYPMPDAVPQLKAQLSPGNVDSVGGFPAWVMHRRPQFLYGVEDSGPSHDARHEPPVDLTVDTETRGKIVLKWQASVDNEYVIISNYEIERKNGEDGEWQSIATIDGVEETYEDSKIQARAKFFYRVTSIAEIDRDNPVVDAEGMQLAESDERQVSRVVGPIETARDIYVIPVTVTQVTDEDLIANANAIESAYVRVYKWDSEEEKFVQKAFTVKSGEKIGKKVKRGRKETDFSTGATLVDVELRSRKHKLGHNEQVQWIKYRFEDGTEEEASDKDIPEELKK